MAIVAEHPRAQILEKQERSIKYQLTPAKLPLANAFGEFAFAGTPISPAAAFLFEQHKVVLIAGQTQLAIAIARSCVETDRAAAFDSLGKALTERMMPTTKVRPSSDASKSGGKRDRQPCQFS